MYKNNKIIIIIPVYNEAGKTLNVVRQVPDYIDSILVVNDASTDGSIEELKGTRCEIIHHKVRRRIGSAIRTGIDYAIQKKFDIIVVLSGNGKDNPEESNRLLDKIIENNYDFIQGSRYLNLGKYDNTPKHRLVFTRAYSLLLSFLTYKKITDATNGFRAYKTDLFKRFNLNIWQDWIDETMEYYLTIKVLLSKTIKFCEVPVSKIYPKKAKYNEYTKIKPFTGWIKRMLPLFYLMTGIKK